MREFPPFAWAVGEEGSDPVVLRQGVPYRHDQLGQSGHLDHLEEDLAAVAGLGGGIVRYGMPWGRIETSPGVYDWSLWDRGLTACQEAGLEPVVDLLHFGLPDHYGGFLEHRWLEPFLRYVEAFLERYPDPMWFTPVNEPDVTALFTARYGMWNDRHATAESYAALLAWIVVANLEALAIIRADRDAWWVGSEGFEAPVATVPGVEDEVERRRARNWLVWDLHLGCSPLPEAKRYFDVMPTAALDRLERLALRDHEDRRQVITGHDIYPTSLYPVGGPPTGWTTEVMVDLAIAELARWHDRYGMPFWVAETSNLSLPLSEQVPWLERLTAGMLHLRREGRPARGICWYSRGDQYDWQTALVEPVGAVTPVGLYDERRSPRPVAVKFAELAASVR